MTDAPVPDSDDPTSIPDESTTWPDCPTCGHPVTSVTVQGPTDGTAHPCGCRLWPGTIGERRLE